MRTVTVDDDRRLGGALHRAARFLRIAIGGSMAAALLASEAVLPGHAIAGDADVRPATEKAQAAVEKGQELEKAAAAGDGEPPADGKTITRSEAQAVDPDGQEPLDDALGCLARTIYWEAKGEDRPGMEAVASVVMNRLGRESFPNTVCGVVKEGRQSGACQFSWWCDGRPDEVEEPIATRSPQRSRARHSTGSSRTGPAALSIFTLETSRQVGMTITSKPWSSAATTSISPNEARPNNWHRVGDRRLTAKD